MHWLFLAILVAIFTSAQDILGKRLLQKHDVYLVTWAWWAFSLPVLYLLLLREGIPTLTSEFWIVLGIDTVLFTISIIYYAKALQAADLSLSVPMLSFTPLFLLVTSPWILDEQPHASGILGVFMIVAGSYMLFMKKGTGSLWSPFRSLIDHPGTRYMLIVAFIFSIGGNLDKIGVRNSSPLFWILALDTAVTIALTGVILFKRRDIPSLVKNNVSVLAALGAVNGVALILQMLAITMTQVPYLIAVKRISILLTAVYGWSVLKEKMDIGRLVGVVLMVAGVIVFSVLH